jgi:hypothetical protein
VFQFLPEFINSCRDISSSSSSSESDKNDQSSSFWSLTDIQNERDTQIKVVLKNFSEKDVL